MHSVYTTPIRSSIWAVSPFVSFICPATPPGHSGMLIEPDGVFVTGDIDLVGVRPVLRRCDPSDLDAFELSLARGSPDRR